tara:strand:- start:1121 stop:2092 length:972 start_codon:yes stop_codon:yes gene_type:complete
MKKPIAIIAGEPNSISSEIIFKCWKLRKKFKLKPFIIIGSIQLLNLQKKKLKYNIPIKQINHNFKNKDLISNKLLVYNIKFNQKSAFEKISSKSNKYIFKSFESALKLIKEKKVLGIINCPVIKEFLFKKKHLGITEYLGKKSGIKGKEVMLIYNKELSVSPLTTHIPLNLVNNKIKKMAIVNKVKTINSFYKKNFNKKPKIAILGLNPHNSYGQKKSQENKVIVPAIKKIKKIGIKVFGPISTDTSFIINDKKKFDVIFGMYHDQVLTPFKALFKYNAINITLGLPFIRVSPDHGIAENIVGKNIANHNSLMNSIKFFNNID